MNLLFKRSQTNGGFLSVRFRLWGKIELDEDEQALLKRYRIDKAILIEQEEPMLAFLAKSVGIFVFLAVGLTVGFNVSEPVGWIAGLLSGGIIGYWYYHKNRETIYVRDLLHGRYFSCTSVIDLARKEAWLETVSAFFRQVMESAKHWDGTDRHVIEALPKDEAKNLIIKGI